MAYKTLIIGSQSAVNNKKAHPGLAAFIYSLTSMFCSVVYRYKAIVWPLKVRTSKTVVTAVILIIWMGSTVFALPALMFSTT